MLWKHICTMHDACQHGCQVAAHVPCIIHVAATLPGLFGIIRPMPINACTRKMKQKNCQKRMCVSH